MLIAVAAANTTIRARRPLRRDSDGDLTINVPLYHFYQKRYSGGDPRDFLTPVDRSRGC
jgi:hypothetical protein